SGLRLCLADVQSFIVDKKERAISAIVKMGNDNRATEGAAKLVLLVGGCCLGRVVKVISTIQLVVPQEFPQRPVETIGAGLDHGVNDRAVAAAELSAVSVTFNLELLQGIGRGLDHKVGFVQEVRQVGVIVDAVEQEIVLQGTRAI